jgi:hypothetical protein
MAAHGTAASSAALPPQATAQARAGNNLTSLLEDATALLLTDVSASANPATTTPSATGTTQPPYGLRAGAGVTVSIETRRGKSIVVKKDHLHTVALFKTSAGGGGASRLAACTGSGSAIDPAAGEAGL